jgi:hypothetical protein
MFNQVENEVELKPGTRNHKGFFMKEGSYKLVDVDQLGWALICNSHSLCYYVDPDDIETLTASKLGV